MTLVHTTKLSAGLTRPGIPTSSIANSISIASIRISKWCRENEVRVQVLILASASSRVCKQEAVTECSTEDEGLAGFHLLAGIAALSRRAGAVCDLEEVGRDTRTIVCNVDCVVLVAAAGESWTKDVLIVAGIIDCWAWCDASGGRQSAGELGVDDRGRGLDRAGRSFGDGFRCDIGKDRGCDRLSSGCCDRLGPVITGQSLSRDGGIGREGVQVWHSLGADDVVWPTLGEHTLGPLHNGTLCWAIGVDWLSSGDTTPVERITDVQEAWIRRNNCS